ncbi:uncharacterized protein LOC124172267 isoform X2 [Ischnura elegans]|uniref:uncharacterized protein LOC124172267 isoform X2 n=1 Tax=Ischnura elegans TaxID=197161 RepID=UPI001ED88A50|nr:uncharacterized protein LOC124172267 isoform X2 [Ischnura elegans]
MCTKGFKVMINLDVHAVTCPGVWLCPNGKVCLKINILGFSSKTQCLPPVFPLLYHEQFSFEKLISTCRQLVDLQKHFEEQMVLMTLVQKGGPDAVDEVVLATFEIALFDLLYPSTSRRGVLAGIDVDLLMEPSCHFPGIIAPKVEISTKTTVEEINIASRKSRKGYINPKTLTSKTSEKQSDGHCDCHCCSAKSHHPPLVDHNKNVRGTSRSSDRINTIPQLPALPCNRWGGKKLTCQHFKDEDWLRKWVSKGKEKISSPERSHSLQRPASSEAIKNDYCKCILSHRSGYCAVCNMYKKYFPKQEMDSCKSSKCNCQSDIESKSNHQLLHEAIDDSSAAKHSKSYENCSEKNKQHFTDYSSNNRLTAELSRRVRHATNRADYPFLQQDKSMCKCCTHHYYNLKQL